jgi:EamA domain-containing membrane protein RarD
MNTEWLQHIIYSSGDIFLPEKVKDILGTDLIGTSKKTFYVSGWSIVHLSSGIIFGYIYLYFKWDSEMYIYKMFILHTIWEFWQMLIGMSKPYKLTGRSNLIDTIMDTIFFMSGAYIIRKML